MFSKLAIVATVAFAAFAAAAPAPWAYVTIFFFLLANSSADVAISQGQCSTGPQQCCDTVQKADTPQALKALGSLGLQVAADVLVGLTCTPISVIAISGASSWLVTFGSYHLFRH